MGLRINAENRPLCIFTLTKYPRDIQKREAKMRASAEIENVFEVSKHKRDEADKGKHPETKNGTITKLDSSLATVQYINLKLLLRKDMMEPQKYTAFIHLKMQEALPIAPLPQMWLRVRIQLTVLPMA